jgi:hypothetical protein
MPYPDTVFAVKIKLPRQMLLDEGHNKIDFLRGAFPVFGGKHEQRKVSYATPACRLDYAAGGL